MCSISCPYTYRAARRFSLPSSYSGSCRVVRDLSDMDIDGACFVQFDNFNTAICRFVLNDIEGGRLLD